MAKTSIACIAFDGEKILIAHRNPTGQMGDRWEFPGGKVEDGESDQTAIVREFEEEFGVKVSVGEKITETFFMHNGKQIALHAYEIKVPHDGIAQKYVLTEHTEYKWAFPAEIPTLNFVDSDMLIYPDVMKWVAGKK
ncbi:NUDIX domain-containing protein [Treponema ruminis]|uniref:8-oxo-dGTP diphosphatase n=1 Tax=Treponema ruminis TaxID=744515 RepID=A0A7W8LLT7_9SPIR|nr:NUDIX domain-containing protein [Treponema ruminis]MBB5225678.1 8-oxo-dGTP diphosphatase [Treponema ruminis]QSI02367.1 NUDIX domain-containing protein [Treponema ruminis]